MMTSSLVGPTAPADDGQPASALLRAEPSAPDLIGLDVHEACERAAWAGVSLDVSLVARHRGPAGVVVAQSPSPGTRMRERWRVHLLVSQDTIGR